ncbi:MAG: methyltransferase domain-containing protein [Candidatus Diapherotrites archaeon]|nr:methyltransferase domain-containing protein [Candidatus Diapherotrites archaeon]
MGDLDKYAWHVYHAEKRAALDAAYIHGLITWVRFQTNQDYKTILDVPCGNGRLHPWLKKLGYEVEGLDLSEEMVAEAKKNGRNCRMGDMANPEAYPNRKYDVILNWFTSFGYLSEEENERTLQIWSEHIRPGGLLIMDLATPHKDPFSGFARYDNNIVEIMEEGSEGNVRHLHIKLYRDEGDKLIKLRENNVDLRMYSPEEIKTLLERNGFQLLKMFGRYEFHSPRKDANAIVYMAIRQK